MYLLDDVIDVVVKDESIWLTQKAMAELFGVQIPAISKRVNSNKATQFRIWATKTLKEFITKGFVLDDERFYAMVQNKFHFAITGSTAAEIIYKQADRNKKNMGLTTWKNSPDGRILKSDVLVAKNYLQEKEIRRLERTVSGYFDYIEDLVENENTFTMQQLAASVNEFLNFRKYKILQGKGKVSKVAAEQKAAEEYEEFNKTQKIISDFDKRIAELRGGK